MRGASFLGELLKLYRQSKSFDKGTANQEQHRFTNADLFERITDNTERIVDIKKELFLKEDGTATIVFDILHLQRYTLTVGNPNEEDVVFTIHISPDNHLQRQIGSRKVLRAGTMEVARIDHFVRYVQVSITGTPFTSICVYLQAHK